MTTSVGDLALLSDCRSAAMVDRDGSVLWWCPARFDAAPVFARLLDPAAGHLRLAPAGRFEVTRRYLPGTLVLETTFRAAGGRVRITDALAFASGARGHDVGFGSPGTLARAVECLDGEVELELEFAPRPDFGLVRPWLVATDRGVRTVGGPDTLALDADRPLDVARDRACGRWVLRAGERADVAVRHREGFDAEPPPAPPAAAIVADTVAGWRSWGALHQVYDGAYAEEVRCAAVVLQGLTFVPTGALVAAPTTSLPEVPGGDANWDYRYAWLRDASLNIRALQVGACVDEAGRYLRWMARAASSSGAGGLPQVVFGVDGRRDLRESELDHLAGFGGARPVRVGNAAWRQRQLDVPGEVLAAAALVLGDDEIEDWLARALAGLADAVADEWREDDSGIWEGREGRRPYTPSKVLAWAALDRALELAPRLRHDGAPDRWARERDAIRAAVLERAWNDELGAFAGAFGSDRLDAGVLLMPIAGFLPMSDPRMRATVDTVVRELGGERGTVRRWTGSGEEGGFAICSFWLAECLALAGEEDRAREVFEGAASHANDVGLLGELLDGRGGSWGNAPQAFVHAGLVCAASAIDRLAERRSA